MTLLDRYLGKRMLGALLKTILALVFLFVLIDILTHRRDSIMRNELTWMQVGWYYLLSTPRILSEFQLSALAILIAALLVLGQAAQNNEITAALAGGISLRRIVRTPVLVGLGLALVMFAMGQTVGPWATGQAEQIEQQYFDGNMGDQREGVTWPRLAGKDGRAWTCHILKFNRQALTGEDVLMHNADDAAAEQIQAGRIFWDPDTRQWLLEDGRWFHFTQGAGAAVERITQAPAPITNTPEELFALERPPDTKTAAELAADLRRAEQRGVPTKPLWVDYHAKFSQPALNFVMIWLAVPFAMRLRKGGLAIGFGVSIAVALVYLVFFRIGMGLGRIEQLPPIAAAWMANVVFYATGVILFWRTPT